MKNLWYIAKKDLLQILKDRSSLFFLLLVPLILIVVVGFAFGNLFGSGSSQVTITVAVSNQDSGFLGKSVVQALQVNASSLKITINQYTDPSKVKDQVANNSSVNAGVVIPAGASDKFIAAAQTGTAPKDLVQVYSLPSTSDPRATIVQNIVTGVLSSQFAGTSAVGQVNKVCNQPGNHCAQSSIDGRGQRDRGGNSSSGIDSGQSRFDQHL